MLTKRIIPCLDIKKGRVVKGINFVGIKDAGDPIKLAKYYYEQGADELVLLDITANSEKRNPLWNIIEKVANSIYIPFTVGGGITSFNQAGEIIKRGADKITINTNAVLNPKLISDIASRFGSQAVVVAVDVKKIDGEYYVFIKSGKKQTALEAREWVQKVQQLGAGEILLTSIDRDGSKKGYDLEILSKLSSLVNIPVIASGGAGSLIDLKDAFLKGQADAVLAASIFHYNNYSITEVKQYLNKFNIPIRL